ncbi:pyridoxal phosphate-dependent decarboxylase family protein [Mameliella alba]|nr:aminotransferase class V-fold PLP-dependent enzyme [Mameliella alba]
MSDDPVPFAPEATRAILDWTERRIAEGPDPKHGAGFCRAGARAGRINHRRRHRRGTGVRPVLGHYRAVDPAFRSPDQPVLRRLGPQPRGAEFRRGAWRGGNLCRQLGRRCGRHPHGNQTLRWIADLAGWPASAGGVFVAGGTLGNLSALHAAREWHRRYRPCEGCGAILCSSEAHSSIQAVARVMNVAVEADETGRMTAQAVLPHLSEAVFAIVANGGATNCGAVDDIAGLADLAQAHGLWLHVDGAYGGAALAAPAMRPAFDGIERADSLIVDPHEWLFAPYDNCALLYRDAGHGAAAHGQQAVYLDTVDKTHWNPSDCALYLTRRARGLPLWYSLAVHGTEAYAKAIATTRQVAEDIAKGIDAMPRLDLLLDPQLTVILFRPQNMDEAEMIVWGEMVFRLCIVNPATRADEVLAILETLTR